jgi:gliding motility-associated-like protein
MVKIISNKINRIFLLFLLLIQPLTSFGTHYMGGEITWECMANGRYRFTMKLYRECGGGSINFSATETMNVANYPGITSISMSRVSQTDISPSCNTIGPALSCSSPGAANAGTVEEHIYTSDNAYPSGVQLSGIPPANGWIFSYSSCCRNPCTNILNSASLDWYLRAVMYPYGTTNAYPCFDNSPSFAEKPNTVICTGYPFTYNHNAYDKELDSLTYEWGRPMATSTQAITSYATGYSFLSPLPGISHNPSNVPATVNPSTGEIKYTSYTQGAFVTMIKVNAYKCGIKVAEINREMQIVLLPCASNNPPTVEAPFIDPISGLATLYIDTVYAGEVVNFYMSGTDFEFLPNGQPQSLKITASGAQFGSGYTSTTTGCLNPPCATLSPPPPVTGAFGVSTAFSWQTTCAHLSTNAGCGATSNVYNFLIKIADDMCPAPAINISTITIVVLPQAQVLAPDFRCVSVAANGDVTLNWIPPQDTANTFDSYHISVSNSIGGPFSLVDSVMDINQTSYTHVGAGANLAPRYYHIKTRSGCFGSFYSAPSETLKTIFVNVAATGPSIATLTWNAIRIPNLPSASGWYRVFREYPAGVWTFLDSVQMLTYTDLLNLPLCASANIQYKVEIDDNSGCTSVSSIGSNLFTNDYPGLPSPELRCLAVQPSGDVELHWIPITNDSSFIRYDIFSATSASGPFSLVGSANTLSGSSFTHSGANANNGTVFYYISTYAGCTPNNATALDTLQTILLDVNAVSNNIAGLSWNKISDPLPTTSSSWYSVLREFPTGTWTLADSTQSLNFQDTITICYANINYRIEIPDASGCKSVSSVDGNTFEDELAPAVPLLDTVSVDRSNGQVFISWSASTSADTKGYTVFEYNNANWDSIISVFGIGSTSTKHTGATAHLASETYRVAAFDSCNNISAMNNPHSTIFLTYSFDACSNTNVLRWNQYRNMLPALSGYDIMVSIDGSPFVLLVSKAAGDTSFTHTNLTDNAHYCYFIKAFNAGYQKTTSSNEVCLTAQLPSVPGFVYMKNVTVDTDHQIRVTAYVDTSAFIKEIQLLRADTIIGPFASLGIIPTSTNPNIQYIDEDVDARSHSYWYKIQLVDSCGSVAVVSNDGRSICLTGKAKSDLTNDLGWNDYEDWFVGVDRYELIREVDGVEEPLPLITAPWTHITYNDDVSIMANSQGNFCYTVVAYEKSGNPYSFMEVSYSNKLCLAQNPRMFVPNAFCPDGINTDFKPISLFVSRENYYFAVYSRWGERIFETTDVSTSWNGRVGGTMVPTGVYAYYVKYRNAEGKDIEKTGTVSVLR